MVSIPKNPFTEERRAQLKESAQEFLMTFSKEYLKAFGFCLLESVMDEGDQADGLKKLKYRNWNDVERPHKFQGVMYFKAGNGPGTWSKWKEAYLVEMQDYKIQVYKTEKDFKAKKKPMNVINPCGYNVVKHVTQHYKNMLQEIGPDIGLTDEEMESLARLSEYAWAVFHPLRTNYIFQLHKSPDNGGCLCLGGGGAIEPDDLGAEEAKGRPKTIAFMQRCANKCQVRDLSTVKGKAFERTVHAMVASFNTLTYFKDDGTEPEILTDMLVRHCVLPMQKPMLDELASAPGKLKIKLWMKTKELIQTGMVNVVKPAWDQMDAATDQLQQKIEPVIQAGADKIKQAKQTVREKVKVAVSDKIGEALKNNVSPHLKKVMQSFEKPIKNGFDKQRQILKSINVDKLPKDQKDRNLALDRIPRVEAARDMEKATEDIIAALEQIKDLADIFDYIEPEVYRQQAEDALLSILDAAVYTMQQRFDAEGQTDAVRDQVIQDWESDVVVVTGLFLKAAIKAIIIGGVKKALAPAVDPVLEPIDDVIPDDVKDMLSARALYDELVDLLIGEPIDSMVDGAYPPPK